ncbi:hypothetical protein [Microvirga massiliensis]|uniref:hypothetical protein n=1 Tax=Microvirga massiliensis TaxID=1033741 RepID=UPI00062BD90F|nr:hypothetical protein [Microvirga massiliensis]
MPSDFESVPSTGEARLYSPEITPLLQSLLATLADIDFAYESDVDVVRNSAADEVLKRKVIARLEQQNRERREPYVRQLTALQHRLESMVA